MSMIRPHVGELWVRKDGLRGRSHPTWNAVLILGPREWGLFDVYVIDTGHVDYTGDSWLQQWMTPIQ